MRQPAQAYNKLPAFPLLPDHKPKGMFRKNVIPGRFLFLRGNSDRVFFLRQKLLGACPRIQKWQKNVAFLANILTIF